MGRSSQEISLTKIIVVIMLIAGAVLGVGWFARWFNHRYVGGVVEASAPNDIETARALIAEGKAAEALALLRPIEARLKHNTYTPQALNLMAEICLQSSETQEALALLERATYDFPDNPEQPKVALAYAKLLEQNGRVPDAVAVYREVQHSAPPAMRAPALVGLGRQMEREGDITAARDLYKQAADEATWHSEDSYDALEALGRLNVQLIFSVEPTPESRVYVVEKGDTITSIGARLNTTQGLLLRANNIEDAASLHLGQRLKYTPKDFRIVIERSACRLYLCDSDGVFNVYRVGLGKPGHETTLGSYKLGNKQKDPTWYKPGGGVFPPGDPGNELGTRWMTLEPVEEGLPTDLGIHGTIRPETVGLHSSNGCARLLPEKAEELYDLVVRSTPVTILETFEPQQMG